MDNKVEKKMVETICQGLEQDDDWDEADPFEKAYKSMGLKRYKLDKKQLSTSSEKESYQETVGSSSSKDVKAAPKALTSDGGVEIKIQNPEYVQLQSTVKTSKSATAAVGALASQFKKLLPSLLVLDVTPEGLFLKAYMYLTSDVFCTQYMFCNSFFTFIQGQTHIDKCRLCISNLDALHEELGVLVAKVDRTAADQLDTVGQLQRDVNTMSEKAEYSLDAAKLVKNKLTSFLASK